MNSNVTANEATTTSNADDRLDSDGSHFHCGMEWHLAQMKHSYTALVHPLALRIAGDGGYFHASAVSVADYLKCSRWSVGRAFEELEETEFFVRIRDAGRTRREGGQFTSNTYQVFSHTTWATTHPGQCTVKIEYPWSVEAFESEQNQLGQRLFRVSGFKFSRKDINFFRATGRSDTEIAVQLEEMVRSSRGLTQKWARNRLLKALKNGRSITNAL